LANLAINFENEAAPCNSFTNLVGENFEEFMERRLDTFSVVIGVVFEMDQNSTPFEMVSNVLSKIEAKNYEDFFLGNFE